MHGSKLRLCYLPDSTKTIKMKINEPVTQQEIDYPESYVFVTKTDTKGIITYANDSFVEISGFSRNELLGVNHNVVRHPDMPEWAFADLWKTIKNGYPWSGIVKNRAKSGDHYWVKASVSPIKENGNIIGHISLRKKPTRQEISAAEKLYRTKNVSLKRGGVWFKNLSLQSKLQILTQPMLFILLVTANIGISDHLKTKMVDSVQQVAKNVGNEIIDGANMLMVTGQIGSTDNRTLLLKKISSSSNIVGIRLVRAEQVVKQFGEGLPEERVNTDLQRTAIANKQPYYGVEEINGKPVFRAVTPYIVSHNYHGTDCMNCHQVEDGSVNGASDVLIDMSDDFQDYRSIMVKLIAGQVILQLLLFFFMGWTIRRFISNPVHQVTRHLENLVNGNSNMSNHADISGRDEMGEILCSVQSTKVMMGSIIDHITAAAKHIDGRARHLSTAVAKVLEGSTAQSDAASSMAAAIQEMSVTIDQITDNTEEVKKVSEASKDLADKGNQAVAQIINGMAEINHSVQNVSNTIQELGNRSAQIQAIVNMINEIAAQTNLLALNAAIEAARAGEHGRGFAVVADEVRNLAEKTNLATKDIQEMVSGIHNTTSDAVAEMQSTISKMESGVEFTGKAGDAIAEINAGVLKVLNGVEGILSSLKEQTVASHEIAGNVERIAQMAERNSVAVDDVDSTAKNLEAYSEELHDSVKHFKI